MAEPDDHIAILFDIDETLIITGGAGAASWRLAFDELYGIPADIGEFTDTGMTDPDVGRKTFEAVMHRTPERKGAHAAGMQCVGVGSHHFNVEHLRDAGADYAIASLEEALPL